MKFSIYTLIALLASNMFSQLENNDQYTTKIISKDRQSYLVHINQDSIPLYLLGIKKLNLKTKRTHHFKITKDQKTLFSSDIIPLKNDILEITIDLIKNEKVSIEFESERIARTNQEHAIYIEHLPEKFINVPQGSLGVEKIKSFYVSKHEVTQHLWSIIMGERSGYFVGAKRPVESVSYSKVQEFISKLNNLSGLKYRLPNHQEWEYAAKGGPGTPDTLFAQNLPIDSVCWYHENNLGMTSFVGEKTPNSIGLYDMGGNVWEWCEGSQSETHQIIRGGSLNNAATYCTNEYQNLFPTNSGASFIGFRLAIDKLPNK